MTFSLADKVRAVALLKYVGPAKKRGAGEFSIAVKDLLKDLESVEFPLNYTPLVCNAIRTKSFQRENHLEITAIDGPRSQTGTRVVIHYRILDGHSESSSGTQQVQESPTAWAERMTEGLRGLLRREIKEMGGAEAFVNWVRSDDEDAA